MLTNCPECGARVEGELGHRPECSQNADDGSEEHAKAWLASRPPHVRAILEKYPFSHLFSMKPHNHRVFILSFAERKDGTITECTVGIRAHLNPGRVFLDREVFGVLLSDLEDLGEYKPESEESNG